VIPPHKVAEAMWREDEASRALGMKLEEVGPGSARLSMTVQSHMANGQKVCHGGYIFTLADSAFGYACNTHNQRTVSASASIDYVAPAFVEDRLTAEAREVERQERRAIHDVKVVNQKGETVALLRGTSRA
jgi:acyl-CoA thioesterase